MKNITKEQIEDIMSLRRGKVVDSDRHTAYASYKTLANVFNVSRLKIKHLCQKRFEE